MADEGDRMNHAQEQPEAPYLSLVIPAYNEALRIEASLQAVMSFISNQHYKCELILVDDGSTDATIQVMIQTLQKFPYTLIRHQTNLGKGAAVRNGILSARGDNIVFTDADLSTPLEEIHRVLPMMKEFDAVIGSRALPDSRVEVHQNILRELMGKTFNRIARLFAFHGIHDSQCGFKCFQREPAYDVFRRQKINGFAFDVEILYLMQKKKYRIREEPVIWRNSKNSRVQIILDPLRMFRDVLRIRWLHRHEKY